jgi:YebC/PmpR family DNA-binding regulatory protein
MGRHGTIAGRKASQDSKRAQVFTKYSRAITVAAKGGGDPSYNMTLKHAIDKAKGINMPNDNIARSIKKGTGELAGEIYEENTFEGYGAGGVAVIVDVLTDNRNRSTAAIKHSFDKYGGNLGAIGCVSYMFDKKGIIIIEKTEDINEDQLMEAALEAGMEDMITHEDSYDILTAPDTFNLVSETLKNAGYEFVEADIELVPSLEVTPTNDFDIKALKKMIAALEENDDVQKVHHNCTIDLTEE